MKLLINFMDKMSKLMFCLLFPVVFFYGSALEFGVIQPILGGGVGIFLVITFFLLFPAVLFTSCQLKREPFIYFIVFIVLLLYTGGYLIFHYFFGADFHQRPDVVRQWLILIVGWGALFSIGYFGPRNLTDIEKAVLVYCFIFMSAIILMNPYPDPNAFITALGRYKAIVGDIWSDYFLTYQGYARAMSVTGLIMLAVIRQQSVFWIMSCLMMCALFYLGSRSEILCVLIIFPIFIFYHLTVNFKTTAFISFVVVTVLGLLIMAKSNDPNLLRQMEIFNLANSSSFQVRMSSILEALEAIKISPISGDFSGHVRNHESLGHYAHNILSSWRQLGFVGFLLYGLLLVWPPVSLICHVIRNRSLMEVDVWRISIVITVYMLLLSLTSKSIFSSVIALGWGLYVGAIKILTLQKN